MKKLVAIAITALLSSACSQTATESSTITDDNKQAQNIIMIVADGMGPAYTSAYRYFNDDPTTKAIESTVFDRHLVGLSSTYPAAVSGYVTDSAASATALATGHKSYNGAIGVDVDKQPVKSVLHKAKSLGYKTGVVVTSQVNHATPASYLTHNESRKNYNQIADSYVDGGIQADVILGGGTKYFIRDDRNLVEEFKAQGFQYIENYEQLSTLDRSQKTLGLFAEVALPFALDDSNSHRLSMMTKAAINQLENENGFFMLIEASQVDWGGHSNDIASAMGEMEDLAKTIEYLEQYVSKNPNTLVVLTADHSTGGFTIGANGKYEWSPQTLRQMTMSTYSAAKHLLESDITQQAIDAVLPIKSTVEEVAELKLIKAEQNNALATYNALPKEQRKRKPNPQKSVYLALNKLIDVRTTTGWTTGGHTGIDVPVFAFGANKAQFSGMQDNTDIAKKIFTLLSSK